ncbi:MAG: response regulator [gamma proteobacterium symbiont of Bathyaustriella thionipta]|nr:response regulator [gamma proteobacterium symbiont of Bathyaustriella thionipta]MCU7949825.1 response regulator [gamma proteobacterium symbiont of Bathyaustriella thionipta]MCU7952691.1 response regulator [gamma proteobacterium symbiont of Bathyaustriella thionipta]MCU7956569.1 response regulator [gamma proteobacterium symbiont of Bathyaustriella thionipta]MCU7967137.1 response regulator [gamma proteobacterium symbiont of Bathyaustriella thionipta]
MNDAPSVFIVDDDEQVRSALTFLMESVGLQAESFSSAHDYLEQFNASKPGCLILDVRMPGLSGLDLQARLSAETIHPPIIIITGHGDVPMAVRAVTAGAVDFIEKPFNNQSMLDNVHRAIELDAKQRGESSRLQDIEKRYNELTPREKEVLQCVIEGKRNKIIAAEMNISQSTVEAHRSKVMDKMLADSLSDLMRMALLLKLIS